MVSWGSPGVSLPWLYIHFQPFSQSHSFIVMSSCSASAQLRLSLPGATHTSSQHKWLCGVDSDCADVVRVCLKRCDFLGGVVVVDAHLEVIGT
jgi:hypothetical protein